MAKITVKDTSVTIISVNENDYISLTDIAKYKSDDPTAVIGNWLRNRNTIEYLGIWESLYNPNFKPLEFEGFETRVIKTLPNTKEFNGIPVAHPVSDNRSRIIAFMPCQISYRYIILTIYGDYCYIRVLNNNFCH